MKYLYSIRIFLCSFSLFFLPGQIIAQTSSLEIANPKHEAEDLWASIDELTIRKQIIHQTNIPSADIELFMKFITYQFPEERSQFFKDAEIGKITSSNIQEYAAALTQKYINTYPLFLIYKTQFAIQQSAVNNLPLSINGPCENVDFEDGTTTGWQGFTGLACQQTQPCSLVNGFVNTRHEIMTTTMVDPYIPTLPVVAPGGNFSLRLENYVNGGNATMVQQTFLVTPTNNVFTYRYAAVLEDPGAHGDLERPYFRVRMYDKNGQEITCATYTAIAKPPIKNFTYVKVPNPNFDPTQPANGGNNQFLDLYYRDWTTVTIPLLGFVGQNVTIQFTASDCSRGGHLGYAYIDAKCAFLTPQIPPTICGAEDIILYGPDDFATYLWSGPGIVGSNTTQNISANKSGKYTLKLTPLADNPCPITISTTIPERCVPSPISANLCESTHGTLLAKAVDLTKYNTPITAYNALGSVLEWHTGKPATNANRIADPTKVNITNGGKFYAVIKYSTAGSDTAEIDFKLNSLPIVQFSSVSPFCEGGSTMDITSHVSPLGGVFKGNSITSSGVFSPTTAGTYSVTYVATNVQGCKDSIKSSIVVNKAPTITLGADQKKCSTSAGVTLQATAKNQTSVLWSGGAGVFSSAQSLTTNYTPTSTEINTGSIMLSATVAGKAPCANKSDDVLIEFVLPPKVNAGIDQDLCIDKVASISLSGSGSLGSSYTWSGGAGIFASPNSFNTTYQPSVDEIKSGTLTFKITASGNAPCLAIYDEVSIYIHEIPQVNAGPDRSVCAGTVLQFSTPLITNNQYYWASKNGVVLSNTNDVSVTADKDSVVVLKVTNQFGCINRDTVKIEAYTPPSFDLGGPYCLKDQLVLHSNPTIFKSVSDLPKWKKDGTELTGEKDYNLLVKEAGEYMIEYTHGECIVSTKTHVFNNPVLKTPDFFTVCEQEEITVTTTSIPNAYYVWESKGVILLGNTNEMKINSIAGKHEYKIFVTDQNYCRAIDSFLIIGVPNPVVSLTDTSICGNIQVKIDGTPLNIDALTGYPLVYEWKYNNGVLQNTDSYYTTSKAGTYSVTVSIGNCSGTDNMEMILNPIPDIHIPNMYKICPDTNGEITLDAGAGTGYSYQWTPGGEVTQTIKVKTPGYYFITVTNDANCSNSAKTYVRELCPPRLFVADAFSPNHDGTNDMFNVYGVHIGTFKLLIFNRWGEVIFESKDKDYYWDGIYKGEVMPIGVYPWVITYEGDSQEYLGPYKLEGSVTIVR